MSDIAERREARFQIVHFDSTGEHFVIPEPYVTAQARCLQGTASPEEMNGLNFRTASGRGVDPFGLRPGPSRSRTRRP